VYQTPQVRQCQGVPTAYKLSLNQRDQELRVIKDAKTKTYATIIQ